MHSRPPQSPTTIAAEATIIPVYVCARACVYVCVCVEGNYERALISEIRTKRKPYPAPDVQTRIVTMILYWISESTRRGLIRPFMIPSYWPGYVWTRLIDIPREHPILEQRFPIREGVFAVLCKTNAHISRAKRPIELRMGNEFFDDKFDDFADRHSRNVREIARDTKSGNKNINFKREKSRLCVTSLLSTTCDVINARERNQMDNEMYVFRAGISRFLMWRRTRAPRIFCNKCTYFVHEREEKIICMWRNDHLSQRSHSTDW